MTVYVSPGLCFTAGAVVGFFVGIALLSAVAVILGNIEKEEK